MISPKSVSALWIMVLNKKTHYIQSFRIYSRKRCYRITRPVGIFKTTLSDFLHFYNYDARSIAETLECKTCLHTKNQNNVESFGIRETTFSLRKWKQNNKKRVFSDDFEILKNQLFRSPIPVRSFKQCIPVFSRLRRFFFYETRKIQIDFWKPGSMSCKNAHGSTWNI